MGRRIEKLKRARAYAKYTYLRTYERISAKGPFKARIYRAEFYNCFGDKIYTTDVTLHEGQKVRTGVLVDMRSIDLIKDGCCPLELSNDILES